MKDRYEREKDAIGINIQDFENTIKESKIEAITRNFHEQLSSVYIGFNFDLIKAGINETYLKHIMK